MTAPRKAEGSPEKMIWVRGPSKSFWSEDPVTQAWLKRLKAEDTARGAPQLSSMFPKGSLDWINAMPPEIRKHRPISIPLGTGSKTKEGK